MEVPQQQLLVQHQQAVPQTQQPEALVAQHHHQALLIPQLEVIAELQDPQTQQLQAPPQVTLQLQALVAHHKYLLILLNFFPIILHL